MSKKVSRCVISELVKRGPVMDVTRWECDDLYKLEHNERGFDELLYSMGYYGGNGLLLKGRESGRLYGVTDRTNAYFILCQ